jgi:uncharacterized LabA/DUF88 family protein
MRTTFLVDGFNVYHSLRDASRELGFVDGRGTKWLNLHTLLNSQLHLFGRSAVLSKIYYFTAFAHQRRSTDPQVIVRHERYIECVKDTGVEPVISRFKKKSVHCTACRKQTTHYEEKETDVAIAVKLFELLMNNHCDRVVLVTGDTDLAPAVRDARRLFPSKEVCFGFPYRRTNQELKQIVSTSFSIDKATYVKHQFADPYVLKNGRSVTKPQEW